MEETGYAAEKLIQLGAPVYSHYYNEKKDSYRRSYAPHYLAIVSGEPKETAREDHETFEIEWFDYDTLHSEIIKTGGGVEHWLVQMYLNVPKHIYAEKKLLSSMTTAY